MKRLWLLVAVGILLAGLWLGVLAYAQHQPSKQPSFKPAATAALSHEPVALTVPKVAISTSAFEHVGIKSNGELAAPSGWDNLGWFDKSATPGDTGPSVIVGHLNSTTGPAVFWRLHELAQGDEVDVTRADHKTAVFIVDHTEVAPQNNQFPTQEVYGTTSYSALRLITCQGQFVNGRYTQNYIVFAKLAKLQ